MKMTKKAVSYILVFLMVFSSFAILPSEFWGWANVSAVDLTTEETQTVETNEKEIAVETNKDEIVVEKSNAGATYTEGDFKYSVINNFEVEVVGYNGTSTEVVIPDVTTGSQCEELANKKVTAIGDSAFCENATLTTLTLPNNLKTIGSKAFYGCTKLAKLDIGSNLTKIGAQSFSNCTSLSCVNIKSGMNTVIDSKAFYKCSGIKTLTIGDGVKSIGGYAFSACGALETVTIGKDCTSIATTAFADNTSLNSITISEKNTKYISDNGVWLNKEKTEILLFPKARGGAYTIPDTVTTIKENQFRNCKNLTEIIIGDGVETIGKCAFQGCTKLSNVTFGENIKSIEDKAFYNIHLIETVDLSVCTNLTKIGNSAFYYNLGMKTLLLPDSLEIISDNAFLNCKYLLDLVIKDKITSIGEYAFADCHSLLNVNIEGGNNAVIGYRAFKSCTSLGNLTIGNGVKIIGESAFGGCYGIVNIVIGDTVTSIEQYAFSGLSYVKEIRIGKGITSIAAGCFYAYYVKNLRAVQIQGKELTYMPDTSCISAPSNYSIYCYEGSNTHKTVVNAGYGYRVKFFKDIYPTNIIVNGTAVKGFDASNREYVIYADDVKDVKIKPVFNNDSYSYEVSAIKNVYSVDLFNEDNIYSGTYTITVKKKGVSPTDIKVNGISIHNFNVNTSTYDIYAEDVNNINIVPVFEQDNVNYKITSDNNVYTLNVFDEYENIVHTYKITVIQKVPEVKYAVMGDVTLMLNNISSTKVGGSIVLQAGTYKLKIAKGEEQFGYNKTVADYCNGLTLSEKYASYITLNATGGTYTFQFDTITNKLVIKHHKNLPNEYLIGDIDTILKPMGNRPLSIGTQQLPAGTYMFKLSIGGKEYGYNKVVDNATAGSLSLGSSYSSQITLNATGGMYTFVLNTETNKLIIRHIPTDNEATTDVHISGTFNLVLNDKSTTGEDLTTATGTINLASGCYTFKVYNYGVAYTAGLTVNDSGKKTLSSKYTTPVTLNATGGTYQFTFDKATGALTVSLVK